MIASCKFLQQRVHPRILQAAHFWTRWKLKVLNRIQYEQCSPGSNEFCKPFASIRRRHLRRMKVTEELKRRREEGVARSSAFIRCALLVKVPCKHGLRATPVVFSKALQPAT